jgi:hypothetical protein
MSHMEKKGEQQQFTDVKDITMNTQDNDIADLDDEDIDLEAPHNLSSNSSLLLPKSENLSLSEASTTKKSAKSKTSSVRNILLKTDNDQEAVTASQKKKKKVNLREKMKYILTVKSRMRAGDVSTVEKICNDKPSIARYAKSAQQTVRQKSEIAASRSRQCRFTNISKDPNVEIVTKMTNRPGDLKAQVIREQLMAGNKMISDGSDKDVKQNNSNTVVTHAPTAPTATTTATTSNPSSASSEAESDVTSTVSLTCSSTEQDSNQRKRSKRAKKNAAKKQKKEQAKECLVEENKDR